MNQLHKQYFLFDLDGTLTDPAEGITNSVAYALDSFGIHVEDPLTLCKFIGPPLKESFQKYYNFSDEQAETAVWKYREYFSDRGILENVAYPGIAQMLEQLKEAKSSLILATSKPTVYARQILEHFALDGYFTDVQGSELDGARTNKSDVIAYALQQNGITDPQTAIMVGDREHDILGASSNALESVGVLFGYGDQEELEMAGADHIVATVEELTGLLLSMAVEREAEF